MSEILHNSLKCGLLNQAGEPPEKGLFPWVSPNRIKEMKKLNATYLKPACEELHYREAPHFKNKMFALQIAHPGQ